MDETSLEEKFNLDLGGNFDKKIKKKNTKDTTKNIVIGSALVSLILPIIMAVFLVMTINDIDYGESRESCNSTYFTNPGNANVAAAAARGGAGSGAGNFQTYAIANNNIAVKLNPNPCQTK